MKKRTTGKTNVQKNGHWINQMALSFPTLFWYKLFQSISKNSYLLMFSPFISINGLPFLFSIPLQNYLTNWVSFEIILPSIMCFTQNPFLPIMQRNLFSLIKVVTATVQHGFAHLQLWVTCIFKFKTQLKKRRNSHEAIASAEWSKYVSSSPLGLFYFAVLCTNITLKEVLLF